MAIKVSIFASLFNNSGRKVWFGNLKSQFCPQNINDSDNKFKEKFYSDRGFGVSKNSEVLQQEIYPGLFINDTR